MPNNKLSTSICQVQGCGRTAVTEIAKSNTPHNTTYDHWIPLCFDCRKDYPKILPLMKERKRMIESMNEPISV